MAMSEVEAIRKSFRNPTTILIRASEWLLLYTIHHNREVCSDEIQRKLGENWEKVNSEKPRFYVAWSNGSGLSQELGRYREMGIVEQKENNRKPCWILTETGEKLLKEWQGEMVSILGSLANNMR
jgi:hypothetical protein